MRKVLSVLVCILLTMPAFATGDATPTSKGYVDAQMETLQDNLPAAATNTVVTTTATAGETGTKAIYDSTGNYVTQQDALVTAEDANTAIQMAINGELVCREYDPTGQYCYVYDVHPTVRNNILPNGYTALEYLESTGTQWIDTNYKPNNRTNFEIQYMYTKFIRSYAANTPYGCTDLPNSVSAQNGLFRTVEGGFTFNRAAWGGNVGNSNIELDVYKPYLQTWYTDKYLQNIIYINGDNVATSASSPEISWSANYSLWLFARHTNEKERRYPAAIRVKYSKAWEGDTQIFSLIPARRNSDGELGMYDTISNTFFTNAGTGKFLGPNYLPSGN